ncbi:MAG TPA: carbonic anhydrase [Candidatus Limnocylindrales bacterium]|nr:carbonic anhydrase [Candidatus Limnocylindrales bacterium]
MTEPAGLPRSLVQGYGRFRAGRYAADADRYRHLAEAGQRPRTLVIACSDSRSAPEAVFDAGPGELFVVRNVAALVPVFALDAGAHGVSAALEYAVLALGVEEVVILGHGRCGGIAAALDPAAPLTSTDFVGTWTAGLRDLAESIALPPSAGDDERRLALERRSIEASIDHLRTFPWIRRREADGVLRLHGAWFDIALGELHEVGSTGWRPVPVAPPTD